MEMCVQGQSEPAQTRAWIICVQTGLNTQEISTLSRLK